VGKTEGEKMKIAGKLGLGFGLVVGLLLTVSATGIVQLGRVTSGYQEEVGSAQKVRNLALEMDAGILQVRRSEKDFLVRQDESYYQQGKEWLLRTDEVASELSKVAASINQTVVENDEKVHKLLDAYGKQFDRLFQTSKVRGLNENDGIQLEFRNAAHALEAAFKQANRDELTALYMEMRKHEKDYMLRDDTKYVDRDHAVAATVKDRLLAADLPAEQKSALAVLVDDYLKGFNLLVAKEDGLRSGPGTGRRKRLPGGQGRGGTRRGDRRFGGQSHQSGLGAQRPLHSDRLCLRLFLRPFHFPPHRPGGRSGRGNCRRRLPNTPEHETLGRNRPAFGLPRQDG
jgi:hypothetical protein